MCVCIYIFVVTNLIYYTVQKEYLIDRVQNSLISLIMKRLRAFLFVINMVLNVV